MTPTLAFRAIRAAGSILPSAGARLALGAFFQTRPRLPERADESPTMHRAARERLVVRGKQVVSYRWGSGDETVLLVHGWRGRAAQFAPLVRELVGEGYQVISFDAPAHGESPTVATDMRDWIAAIDELQRRYGRFRLVVGHSFGALASLTAVRSGVTTRAVAAIAGASSPQQFLDAFAAQAQLSPPVRERFEAAFRARVDESAQSLVRHYDAAADPMRTEVELLVVHDRGDRQVPAAASARLHEAHQPRSRLLLTQGWGHSRVLAADAVLDAVLALARGGLHAVDEITLRSPADWLTRTRS